jgi:succinate-acetate transporter protein
MDRMFRVLGFWTGIFTVMLWLGGMDKTSMLFLAQTGFFVLLSYLKLSERMYLYVFAAYLTIFFAGFTYYTTFLMPLKGPLQ